MRNQVEPWIEQLTDDFEDAGSAPVQLFDGSGHWLLLLLLNEALRLLTGSPHYVSCTKRYVTVTN